jgi:hypothetical protein
MHLLRPAAAVLLASAGWPAVSAQTSAPAGPTYDVVSVSPNTGTAVTSNFAQRPDGGFTAANLPVATLIARAYPPTFRPTSWGCRTGDYGSGGM